MHKDLPLVSIGLPVFNGQNYIEEAIESALSQSYTNFELIISDNGSTDDTQKICERFKVKDKRILYQRLDKNYGAAKNYNRTFQMAKGKYFKWLAHDDKLMPTNLEKSVQVLEANADIVLCGSEKLKVDAHGEDIGNDDYQGLNLDDDDPIQRYSSLLEYFSSSFAKADFVFGLIRSSSLAKTQLIGNYTSADFTLLAELVLKGKFHVLKDPLFVRRFHHGMSMSVYNGYPQEAYNIPLSEKIKYKSHAEIAKWYDPKGKVRYIPHFKWLNELRRSIDENNFEKEDSIKLHLYAYRWFLKRFSKSIKKRFIGFMKLKSKIKSRTPNLA